MYTQHAYQRANNLVSNDPKFSGPNARFMKFEGKFHVVYKKFKDQDHLLRNIAEEETPIDFHYLSLSAAKGSTLYGKAPVNRAVDGFTIKWHTDGAIGSFKYVKNANPDDDEGDRKKMRMFSKKKKAKAAVKRAKELPEPRPYLEETCAGMSMMWDYTKVSNKTKPIVASGADADAKAVRKRGILPATLEKLGVLDNPNSKERDNDMQAIRFNIKKYNVSIAEEQAFVDRVLEYHEKYRSRTAWKVVATVSSVKVREEPSTTARQVGSFIRNEIFHVTEQKEKWVRVHSVPTQSPRKIRKMAGNTHTIDGWARISGKLDGEEYLVPDSTHTEEIHPELQPAGNWDRTLTIFVPNIIDLKLYEIC